MGRTIVILLVLIAGGAGAGAYLAPPPLYESSSIVYISPTVPDPDSPTGVAVYPLIDGFIAAQVAMLKSPDTMTSAMEDEDWVALGRGVTDEVRLRFQDSVKVRRKRGTHHIVVRFRDEDPRAAQIGVDAVVEEYMVLAADRNPSDLKHLVVRLEKTAEELSAHVRTATNAIISTTEAWGGPDGLDMALQDAVLRLRDANAGEPNGQRLAKEAAILSRKQADIARLVASRDRTANRLERTKDRLGHLTISLDLARRISLLTKGNLPKNPTVDQRKRYAAIGAGAGLLFGLLLGLAFRRRRSR